MCSVLHMSHKAVIHVCTRAILIVKPVSVELQATALILFTFISFTRPQWRRTLPSRITAFHLHIEIAVLLLFNHLYCNHRNLDPRDAARAPGRTKMHTQEFYRHVWAKRRSMIWPCYSVDPGHNNLCREGTVCMCVCVCVSLCVYLSVKGSIKGQTSLVPQKHTIHLPLQLVSELFWGSELGPLSWRPPAIWKQWCPIDVQNHWQVSLPLNSHILLSSLNSQKYL